MGAVRCRTVVLVAVVASVLVTVALVGLPWVKDPSAAKDSEMSASPSSVPRVTASSPANPSAAGPPQSEEFVRAIAAVATAFPPPGDGTRGCVPPPVVCQAEAGCAAARPSQEGGGSMAAAADGSCGGWELPQLDARIAAKATSVIVEVGTNSVPESSRLRLGAGAYTVAVEPLHVEGGQLWEAKLATVLVSAAAGPARERIELSVEGVMSGLGRGPAQGRTQPATVMPLREVVERLVPERVDARFLVVDAQGFDTAVVLSAGEQLKRFRYVVIECQELWPEHPARYNPKSPTCSEAARQLASNGSLVFVGCMKNAAINEYNCLFAQRDHPVVSSPERLQEARRGLFDFIINLKKGRRARPSPPPSADAAAEGSLDLTLTTPAPSETPAPLSLAGKLLRYFVPEDADAEDLAGTMCGRKNASLPPGCNLVIGVKDLNNMKSACSSWAFLCVQRPGSPRVPITPSGLRASKRCNGIHERCTGYI